MLAFSGQAILLDIEGTVAPIAYVFDVMFPFARREVRTFLAERMEKPEVPEPLWRPEVAAAAKQIAVDAGFADFDALLAKERETSPGIDPVEALAREVERQMDADRKWTGLKSLQGMIWNAGFASGELVAQVFDDVPEVLRDWKADERDVRIYSSGSVAAQKAFFGHTQAGNLLSTLRGHFDTTVGSKKEAKSYAGIAQAMEYDPYEILFVSDVPAELRAAEQAGLATAFADRPGNPKYPGEETYGLRRITSLRDIEWTNADAA